MKSGFHECRKLSSIISANNHEADILWVIDRAYSDLRLTMTAILITKFFDRDMQKMAYFDNCQT